MDYLKVQPTPNLEQEIEAYCFFKTAEDMVISDLYFPNGLPAIVFHLGNPFKYFSQKGYWEVMPRISLVSCATPPVALNSGGNTDTIAIILMLSIWMRIINRSIIIAKQSSWIFLKEITL